MTIDEMRNKKKEYGLSYERISDLSGVPLSTIQKIFSGQTDAPRYATLLALEKMFASLEYSNSCVLSSDLRHPSAAFCSCQFI